MNTKYQKKLAWGSRNSPTQESYIDQRLKKINSNPIKVTKDEIKNK